MEGQNGSAGSEEGPFHYLDALPVGIFIALPGGRPYYANREAVRLLGRGVLTSTTGPQLATAYQAYLIGTDEIYPTERSPLIRALGGETTYVEDIEIRRPDGTAVPIEVWGTPVFGPTGSVEHGIATFIDISERKRAEAALASRRALLDLAHDAAFLTDTDARINYWNTGAEQTYGYTPAEAVGRLSHELLRTEFPLPLADIEAKVARDGQWDGELAQTCSDGRAIFVVSRWAAHRAGDGRLLGTMQANRDITSLKRDEAELLRRASALERANIQLTRSNEELEQFAYVASHDLSEPLRAISGPISLLARRYRDQLDAEADQFIEFAVDGCRRMQSIIDDLLALSRAGRVDGELQAVDCNVLVGNVVAGLGARIAETGAIVRVEPLPTVVSQPTQLGQVFQNLISNALKFIPAGVVPEVVVSAERIGDEWDFSVTDNGIGIEPRHRERIFGMFKRLHSRSEYEGSGIGLALCKRIVEREGGRIGVETAPSGQGSSFWFALPIAAPIEAPIEARMASPIAAPIESLIAAREAS
jgi:PAS domain S-box-containing protein